MDRERFAYAESQRHKPPSKGWWAEDMTELGIDLYWRTMIAVKSGGKMPSSYIFPPDLTAIMVKS
jgi:hypothetical protein